MADVLTLVVEMKAKQGKEEELRQALTALVAPTRQEKGCLDYDLHESLDEPGLFIFYENWQSRPDLDSHARSAHIKAFQSRQSGLLEREARFYFLKPPVQPVAG